MAHSETQVVEETQPEEETVDEPTTTQPDGEGTDTPADGETPEDEGQVFETFGEWVEAQDAPVQTLINNHISGLKSALDSERNQRRDLSRQLTDLSEQMEEGSEARQQLEQRVAQMQETERQATFYEQAHAAGATNLRLAYLAAKEGGLLADDGAVDAEALKEQFPELFRQPKPRLPAGNAGSGAGQPPPAPVSMNDLIRKKAGRR